MFVSRWGRWSQTHLWSDLCYRWDQRASDQCEGVGTKYGVHDGCSEGHGCGWSEERLRQFSQIVAAGGSFRRYSVWGIAIEPIVCSCILFWTLHVWQSCVGWYSRFCLQLWILSRTLHVWQSCVGWYSRFCLQLDLVEHCMCGDTVLDDIAAFVCSWILCAWHKNSSLEIRSL